MRSTRPRAATCPSGYCSLSTDACSAFRIEFLHSLEGVRINCGEGIIDQVRDEAEAETTNPSLDMPLVTPKETGRRLHAFHRTPRLTALAGMGTPHSMALPQLNMRLCQLFREYACLIDAAVRVKPLNRNYLIRHTANSSRPAGYNRRACSGNSGRAWWCR
jgi:hypothetical protein